MQLLQQVIHDEKLRQENNGVAASTFLNINKKKPPEIVFVKKEKKISPVFYLGNLLNRRQN